MEEGKPPKAPDWLPKHYAPDEPPAKSPDLPAARKYVARNSRLSAEEVEALPATWVLLRYLLATYAEYRDDIFRTLNLPYSQALPLLNSWTKRLHAAPTSEGHVMARILLPALPRVLSIRVRLERTLAALRVVEALRMYAAAHDGKLPDKLDEITEAPLPLDPGTGKPFEYSRDGDTATVAGPNNEPLTEDIRSVNGVRYRVTIRKK
jgi:hypothetical protein